MNLNAVVYAIGAILLGAVGIWFGDFAMQWQGVPKSIPLTPWAYVSGAILAISGALILARREKFGALLLASFYGLWVVAFHLPVVLTKAIGSIGAWNPSAESVFLVAGGQALFAAHAGGVRDWLTPAARVLGGASAIVFGSAMLIRKYAT
jgi:hypothetical protein